MNWKYAAGGREEVGEDEGVQRRHLLPHTKFRVGARNAKCPP